MKKLILALGLSVGVLALMGTPAQASVGEPPAPPEETCPNVWTYDSDGVLIDEGCSPTIILQDMCPEGQWPASNLPDAPCLPQEPCILFDGTYLNEGYAFGIGDPQGATLWTLTVCYALPTPPAASPPQNLPETGSSLVFGSVGGLLVLSGWVLVRTSKKEQS
jgi:LPXTG-motif cell wall-anchored protein